MRGSRKAAALISFLVSFAPFVANANVIINEAMYDPPGSDSGQEWIELYNAGSSDVDLTKYKFVDGGSATKHGLNVPPKNGGVGSIILPAGSYVIVADDATAFVAANSSISNVIDSTMSMPNPNAGASVTLTLIDDTGATADTFTYVGGTNADGKGDSVQRSANGIIPATPTPGVANATVADTQTAADPSSATSTSSSSRSTQSPTPSTPIASYVPPPAPTLFANAGNDRIVIVGADSEFSASAYDRGQNQLDGSKVRFSWNFGDGQTAEGEVVEHRFDYPGRYAVVLTIAQDKTTASDQTIVSAEPAKLAFSILPDGSAHIENLSGRDLDLSEWIIRADASLFAAKFTLPEHSVILSGSSMHLGKTALGFIVSAQSLLQYPNGVLALGVGETMTPSTPAAVSTTSASGEQKQESHLSDANHPVAAPTTPQISEGDMIPASGSAPPLPQAAAAASGTSSWAWWIAASVLAALSAGAVYAARRFGKDEWRIVE